MIKSIAWAVFFSASTMACVGAPDEGDGDTKAEREDAQQTQQAITDCFYDDNSDFVCHTADDRSATSTQSECYTCSNHANE